jgi:hypothetical protein
VTLSGLWRRRRHDWEPIIHAHRGHAGQLEGLVLGKINGFYYAEILPVDLLEGDALLVLFHVLRPLADLLSAGKEK